MVAMSSMIQSSYVSTDENCDASDLNTSTNQKIDLIPDITIALESLEATDWTQFAIFKPIEDCDSADIACENNRALLSSPVHSNYSSSDAHSVVSEGEGGDLAHSPPSSLVISESETEDIEGIHNLIGIHNLFLCK